MSIHKVTSIPSTSTLLRLIIQHTCKLIIKQHLNHLGAVNGAVVGGAVAGIVTVLIILVFVAWFLKFKRTDRGKKVQ